jgi:hypothetical protein
MMEVAGVHRPEGADGTQPRTHKMTVGVAFALIWLLIAQPVALVRADDRYSAKIFDINIQPIGEESTDYCQDAAILHTAQNRSAIYAYISTGGTHDCVGSGNYLPSGWIATQAQGFKDGASCGWSGWHYSSQSAYGWILWINLCSNPAGSQDFRTRAYGRIYSGSDYIPSQTGPSSPIHAF